MDSQYNFEQKYLDLVIDMDDENIEELLKNNNLEIKNNNLYKKNEYDAIILVNVDDYLIKDLIKKQILFNNNKTIHIKQYYSIKGLLKHLDFKKEEGDRYWEEFLKSNVLDDLVKSLYKKENIFNQEKIIDLFKEHSYYFPNYNTSFAALSHKELFMIYFPPTKTNYPTVDIKGYYIFRYIK